MLKASVTLPVTLGNGFWTIITQHMTGHRLTVLLGVHSPIVQTMEKREYGRVAITFQMSHECVPVRAVTMAPQSSLLGWVSELRDRFA